MIKYEKSDTRQNMKMIKVKSSAIDEVGYNPLTKQMKIKFSKINIIYEFCNVPETIYLEFMQSNSKGIYYHDNIKDNYRCQGF